MAVKAAYEVTITDNTDIDSLVTWYYLTTSATKPAAPTTTQTSAAVPSPWTQNEPTFTAGTVTNYLYCCIQTRWKDGSCTWGTVQLSSAYEQSKQAWNKANAAQSEAAAASAAASAAAITRSDSGKRSIVTEDAAELPLITIDAYGESVQDGAPTPSAPVYIRALRSPHRFPGSNSIGVGIGRATTEQWGVYSGTSSTITTRDDGTVEKTFVNQWNGLGIAFYGESPFQVGDEFNVSCSFRNDSSVNAAISLYAMETNSSGSRVYTGLIVDGTGTSIGFPSVAVGRTVRYSQYCIWTQSCQDLLDAGGSIYLTFQFTNSSSTGGSLTMYNPMLSMGKFPREWAKEGTVLVKSSGKNMLDEANAFYATNMAYYGRISDKMTPLCLSPGTYTISTSDGSVASGLYAVRYDSDATAQTHKQEYNVRSLTFTLDTETLVYVGGYWANSDRGDRKIQLEYGDTATSYELYSESSVSIDLKGNELNGVDSTYRDQLVIDASGHALITKRTIKCKGSDFTVTQYTNATNAWGLNLIHKSGNAAVGIWSGAKSGGPIPMSSIFLGVNDSPWTGSDSTINHISGTTDSYPTNIFCCVSKSDYATIADFNTALQGDLAESTFVFGLKPSMWHTVDLGFVDLPTTYKDGTVHVEAEVQPIIGGSWWTESGYQTGRAHVDSVKMSRASKPLVIQSNATATDTWTGNCPELTELVDGQQIDFWKVFNWANSGYTNTTNYWSQNGCALDLTLSDGSTTGPIPVWYNGNTRLTSHYQAGSLIQLLYKENYLYPGYEESHRVAKGWYCKANYNSDTVYSRSISGGFYTGANGVLSYGLLMKDSNGRWTAIVNNKYSTTTQDKTCYTGGLELGEVLYCSTYYTNGRVTTANTSVSGDLWSSYILDFRYCTNISANTTAGKALTVRQPVYLVGTISDSDGMFHLDTTQWWTQTANDSTKVYIYLGTAYSWYQLSMVDSKPMYTWDGTKLVPLDLTTVVKSQVIYYRTATDSAPSAPTSWVTTVTLAGTSADYNTWILSVPPVAVLSSGDDGILKYPYIFKCTQYKRLDGTIECSTVAKDHDTLVVDGDAIINGSVAADKLVAHSISADYIVADDLHVSAANIDGTLTVEQISAEGISLTKTQVVGLDDDLADLSGGINAQSTALTDAVGGINQSLGETNAALDSLTQTVTSVTTDLDGRIKAITDGVDVQADHISLFTQTTTGGTTTKMEARLTSDKLAFLQNEAEVAYIGNESLNITNAVVEDTLKLGDFAFVPLSTGGVAFKWMGA